MKILARLSLAAALVVTAATAMAADNTGWYAGAGASFQKLELGSGIPELDLRVIQLQAGNRIHENLAIEARAGVGVGDDSVSGGGATLKAEADHVSSIYAKAILPAGAVDVYALAGFTRAKMTLTGSGPINPKSTESDSDFSYGVGASFSATDTISVLAEYNNLYDKEGLKISGFTLGANFSF